MASSVVSLTCTFRTLSNILNTLSIADLLWWANLNAHVSRFQSKIGKKAQECDAKGDAIKCQSRAQKKFFS